MQDKDQASTILRGNDVEYAAKAAMDGWVIEPDIEGLMCEIASMVELCVQPVEQQEYDINFMVSTSRFKCLCAPFRYPISLCN